MSESGDIATPDDGTDVVLEGPREADVAAEIGKSTRRAWLIGAGAFVVVALIVGGMFAMGGDDEAADDGDDASTLSTSTADGSHPATSSYMDTSTVDGDRGDDEGSAHGDGATDDEDGGADGTGPDAGDFIDAGMVAYRIDSEIWVAREDGTEPRLVVDCPDGEYALSLDGSQLALVDCDSETLRLIQTDSGSYVEAGEADPLRPVWSPSSAWVLTERGDEVWLTSAHEERDEYLADGRALAVRDDALALLITPGHDARHLTVVTFDGPDFDVTEVETAGHPSYAAWQGDDLYHVSRVPETGLTRIMRGTVSEPDAEVLVDPLHGVGYMVGYTSLMLSPDGEHLAYAASGDDGYSRVFVVPTSGGTPKELSIRRDAYPLRWSADGRFILFIEGNAFQGEGTRLMRVRPDGMGRQTLVEGAEL